MKLESKKVGSVNKKNVNNFFLSLRMFFLEILRTIMNINVIKCINSITILKMIIQIRKAFTNGSKNSDDSDSSSHKTKHIITK